MNFLSYVCKGVSHICTQIIQNCLIVSVTVTMRAVDPLFMIIHLVHSFLISSLFLVNTIHLFLSVSHRSRVRPHFDAAIYSFTHLPNNVKVVTNCNSFKKHFMCSRDIDLFGKAEIIISTSLCMSNLTLKGWNFITLFTI